MLSLEAGALYFKVVICTDLFRIDYVVDMTQFCWLCQFRSVYTSIDLYHKISLWYETNAGNLMYLQGVFLLGPS